MSASSPLPTIILNTKFISKKEVFIALLSVLIIIFALLFVGVKIVQGISNIETRYDPETLRYTTK